MPKVITPTHILVGGGENINTKEKIIYFSCRGARSPAVRRRGMNARGWLPVAEMHPQGGWPVEERVLIRRAGHTCSLWRLTLSGGQRKCLGAGTKTERHG